MQIGAAAIVLPGTLLAAPGWKKIPIATQAWCVRKQMATDIPGTLAAVAQLGYEGIELENAFGNGLASSFERPRSLMSRRMATRPSERRLPFEISSSP